uniref:Polymerase delta-interacting protein 3 n=2 Tax=Cacopsylla melanoneura TaxID=428564 RepID=A0A8D8YPY9_9HEMI
MDRSLDDIIKSKQIKPFRKRSGSQNGKSQNPPTRKPFVLKTINRIQTHQNGKAPISDARQKIIAKARSTVVDARMKITQKDARLKLNKSLNSSGRISKPRDLRGKLNLRTRRTSPVPQRPVGIIQRTVPVHSAGLRYRELDIPPVTVPLQRTIRNNFTPAYPGGVLRAPVLSHLDMDWSDLDSPLRPDPRPDQLLYHSSSSDLYYNPMDIPLSTRTVRNDLLHEASSLSRSGHSSSHMLSSHLKSRLDTDEPRPRTMGILGLSSSSQGVLRQQSSQQSAPASVQLGHRIVVSNLKDSVNSDDIKELFEDIGPLIASRVVRPGTAEVIYVHQKDAIKAVETYHNRQLDKQPMKCMLVTPRASTNPLVPAVPKLPQATKANTVQPDLAAVHKALFNKHSQMYK